MIKEDRYMIFWYSFYIKKAAVNRPAIISHHSRNVISKGIKRFKLFGTQSKLLSRPAYNDW